MITVFRLARLGLLILLVSTGVSARAEDIQLVRVKNTTGLPASDLHVTFINTGGHVFVAPESVVAPPCPLPSVPSNGTVTNTVTIDWGMPCVEPGAVVSFWVYSINGPLSINNANWTLNGNNIGPVRDPIIGPPPGAGGGGAFWAIVRQTRCFGVAWAIYTPWVSAGDCWERWCCLPNVRCETRTAMCLFLTRKRRLVNTGICIPLGPWTLSFIRRAHYGDQTASIKPPDMGPEIIPIDGAIHNGPPIRRAGQGGRAMRGAGAAKSDNGGRNWSQATDFRSTFLTAAQDLDPMVETVPSFSSLAARLQYYAPMFAAASTRFEALRLEVESVNLAEPDPELGPIANDLAMLRDSLQGASLQFATGVLPTNPLIWENGRLALTDLSTRLPSLMPSRGPQVSQELLALADGFREARDMVALGFTAMIQEENFLYAIFLRILPSMEACGLVMGPHVRINIGSIVRGWYPHISSSGAICHITDASTGAQLDSVAVRVSETGAIDLPIDAYEGVSQLKIGFKFDTFLSQTLTVPNIDGTVVSAASLVNGDATGDDTIDLADVTKVTEELGTGGGTNAITSSDVNADGVVDIDDLAIVMNNQSLIGTGFRLVTGTLSLRDYVGDTNLQAVQIDVTDLSGNLLETHEAPLGNGTYSFLTQQPLGQTVRIGAKGTHWLRQARTVTLGGADEPFAYASGDLSVVSGGVWSKWNATAGDSPVVAGTARLDATTDVIREFAPQLQEPGQVLHFSFDVSQIAANTGNEYYFFFSPATAPYDPGQNYADSLAIIVDFGTGPGGTSNVYAWANTGGTISLIGTMTPGPFHTISGTMVKKAGSIAYRVRIDNGSLFSGSFTHSDPRGINSFEMYQGRPTGTNGNARVDNLFFSSGAKSVTSLDFSLTNGDVDGDNEVGIGDYAQLSYAYGSGPGDLNYIEEADLNGDESVDIADYAILSANYGEVGD
ncbi:MAG: hypothetical protein K1X67_22385 [Fimbriimonadaceae bacterium]|nr:hypothetical protein [Fimbriimonadaceae bacterium]